MTTTTMGNPVPRPSVAAQIARLILGSSGGPVILENAPPPIRAALVGVRQFTKVRERGYSRAQLRWVRGARLAMAAPGEHERWVIIPAGRRDFRRACRAIARGHLDFAQIVSRRGRLVAVVDRIGHGIAHDLQY